MKTRTKKPATKATKESTNPVSATVRTLSASVEAPPHVFVLPKHISPAARIITLPIRAAQTQERYLVDPERCFYEFTRIAGAKRAPRSWLLASDGIETESHQIRDQVERQDAHCQDEINNEATEDNDGSQTSGYIIQNPDLLVATPVDPLFVILSALVSTNDAAEQEFLAPSDYMSALIKMAPHLQDIIRPHAPGKLEGMLEKRLEAVCDCMELGEDRVYALSLPKLVKLLVSKAKQAASKGLPGSLEERFVKQALDIPDTGVKREDSSISAATEDDQGDIKSNTTERPDLQTSVAPANVLDAHTTPTPISSSEEIYCTSSEVVEVLRLRTVFDFLVASYTPPKLHDELRRLFRDSGYSNIDSSALENHLSHIDGLKRQAHVLRTISDNISRKRSASEDEEAVEKAESKRRKKEEEDARKRNTSQGVKKLMKADTSGMKKLSAFFSKTPAK